MNNKVCVELIVPAIEERYNVFIPINKKTLEIIYLLSKAINEMSNGFFEISNKVFIDLPPHKFLRIYPFVHVL